MILGIPLVGEFWSCEESEETKTLNTYFFMGESNLQPVVFIVAWFAPVHTQIVITKI